ncbi:helix-turn-helix domain-containing protein [Spirosoma endbachense]|uniref:Helix-turn-helix domain-containing protein n=2 Tax=Spirosoma endbachense TaxID=2666025 RepID=A0A6P1W811_9BACT|nr:helix-turn-helix domain-containing protein [Spirosoma endbachense]
MRAITEETKAKILNEQFIPDHVFLVVVHGEISFFDASKRYTIKAGECCIVRKNRLVRFMRSSGAEEFEPILFCFEQSFLRAFQKKYNYSRSAGFETEDALIRIPKPALLDDFIRSIKPYYKGVMELDELFEELKYEELLIILLQNQPALTGFLFDFEIPQRIDLEGFMDRNFKFNISIQHFAYLTGRSLSAFKRDFNAVFNDTPGHWLVRRRLQEAYFLIETGRQKPSDFYLDLGFESLSHLSFAFKKEFGKTPSEVAMPN